MSIKCFLGFHENSSYSEFLNFANLMDAGTIIGHEFGLAEKIDQFNEMCAIRCMNCKYSYKAETPNRFDLLTSIRREDNNVNGKSR